MRIALMTELFAPSIGGQEVRFAELADALAMRGHSVHVLCIGHAMDLPPVERLPSGVTVIRRPYVRNYRQANSKAFPRSPWGMLRYAWAARTWIAGQGFDAIFLNQWPLLHVLALSRKHRRQAVIDWCEVRDTPIFRLFQNLLPRLVAANTAVSHDVQQHMQRRSSGPVMMLPSGIARERYRAADPAVRSGILYLGRLAQHKGVPLLIAAYDELCRRGFTERLTIAGGGPALPEIKAAIQAAEFGAQIDLAGMVSEEVKLDLLSMARVLVLPSQREGFPRVVAEAMASGLPTVTTRYAGNGTVGVVEQYACGLCADPTPADIATAIGAVLRDWDRFSMLAEKGAERLGWSAVVTEFEQFLNHVVQYQPVEQKAVSATRQVVGP